MSRQLKIYAVSSLIALMLLTVVLGFIHRNSAINHLLGLGEQNNIAMARILSNGLWPDIDHLMHRSTTLTKEELRALPELHPLNQNVRQHIAGLSVAKVKIYNLKGITIYSTQDSQIGEDQSKNVGFRKAFGGENHTELVLRNMPSADGVLEEHALIASYLPMTHGQDDERHTSGVFEFYYDVTPLLDQLNTTQKELAFAVLAILALLYTSLVMVVRMADRRIQKSEDERQRYIQQIHQQNEELETRIQTRTADLVKTNHALQTEVAVRRRAEEELIQAAVIYRNTTEAIVLTDNKGNIESVNPAFTTVTGYQPHEVVGRNMRILKSGRHDRDFYQNFWNTILAQGWWRGEIWNRRKNGEIYPELATVNAIQDQQKGITHFIAVFSDLSPLKQSEERLAFLAQHDALTGLPNRALLEDRLQQAVAQVNRLEQLLAVMVLDLDRFKVINDAYGLHLGDTALRTVAERLSDHLRDGDTIARVGGDEFVIVVQGLLNITDAVKVADKLLEVLARPMEIEGVTLQLTASIGITIYPFDNSPVNTLLKNAYAPMLRAKKSGGNGYEFFTQKMGEIFNKRLAMERELRFALERKEFHLVYQPKIDVPTGRMMGVEALLRWRNPELGLVPPDQFIPLAEENGLINPLGEWVLRAACQQAMQWVEAGYAPIQMAVNLSGRQFEQKDLIDAITRILSDTGMPPQQLELELTEGMVMEDVQKAVDVLRSLEALGVRIAIDDFGTGYSSLSYLKRFPIHTLKIDRSFVRDILIDPDDAAITRTIIAMAKTLNMKVVAEGVASEDQLEYLRTLECETVQGFLFSPPVAPDEICFFMDEDRHLHRPAPSVAPFIPADQRHQENILTFTKRLEQGRDALRDQERVKKGAST